MTARNELAEAVQLYLDDQGYEYDMDHPDTSRQMGNDIAAVAAAVGYRKPRTITTAEELDALELRSVIRDSDGEPFELTDNGWRYWLYEESFSSLEMSLPATVLHEGNQP